MSKSTTISTPGKLMLFGEHSVVYGNPCIVTAVGQRMQAKVTLSGDGTLQIDAPDVHLEEYRKEVSDLGIGDIPKGAKFVEVAVKNLFEKYSVSSGVHVSTQSQFSSKLGFGSSSASTVCVMKALSVLMHLDLPNKEIFDIAYKTVLDVQGKGSGFDIAAAVYGGTLLYQNGGEVIESLEIADIPLIVAYSGVKADTVTLVNGVAALHEKDSQKINGIFEEITQIVGKAKEALQDSDWKTSGALMNENQELLTQLEVSTPKLDAMISAARGAGAYGAKLSGAGGGDCIIALAPKDKTDEVSKAITQAGGEVLTVIVNVTGAKIVE